MDGRVVIGLYRHGLTSENSARQYIGWHDAELLPSSHEQLREKADKYPAYELILSSDLSRCKETAKILFPSVPLYESDLLRELHFGEWEGKTYDQLKEDPIYQKWLDDQSLQIPGGESYAEFEKRVNRGWNLLRSILGDSHAPENVEWLPRQNITRIALVTHGGVIRHLLTKLTGESQSFWDWKIPFGQGYELSWTAEEWRRGTSCSSLLAVPATAKRNG